jgi:succinate dehydrogenase / fumarate reductase flavoprotein subunit
MMQRRVGIVRSEEDLGIALEQLERLRVRAGRVKAGGNIQYNPGWHLALDLKNMIDISEAVTRAALARTESRGAHTREEYPDSDKDWGRRNIIVRQQGETLQVAEAPLGEMPDELEELLSVTSS